MLQGALLAIIEEAGAAVLTLMEGVEEAEFARSRLTRGEVRRQLQTIVATAAEMPEHVRGKMPELDWNAWVVLGRELETAAELIADEPLWFGIRSLVPATLLWLRVYRQSDPELFKINQTVG